MINIFQPKNHVRFEFRVAQNSQKKGDLHRGAEEFGGGDPNGGLGKFQQNQPRRLNGFQIEFLEMLLGLMIFQKYL